MSAVAAIWTPTQSDFDRFAALSGDDNPIHVDPDYAARTRFGRTVSHGMLLYARAWSMIRDAWPEARHAAQTLMFPNPAYADEPLVFRVSPDGGGGLAVTVSREADGAVVLEGTCRLEPARAGETPS